MATGFNADELDGQDADELKARFARVADTGAVSGGRGVQSAAKAGTGQYDVTFSSDIGQCAYTATVTASGDAGHASAQSQADNRTVRVETHTDDGTEADRAFHLVVTC